MQKHWRFPLFFFSWNCVPHSDMKLINWQRKAFHDFPRCVARWIISSKSFATLFTSTTAFQCTAYLLRCQQPGNCNCYYAWLLQVGRLCKNELFQLVLFPFQFSSHRLFQLLSHSSVLLYACSLCIYCFLSPSVTPFAPPN